MLTFLVWNPAIQLAKLSGFSPIITTASARNEAYVKSLGATHVLDRVAVPLASLSSAVKEITKEPITIVYDSISEPETQNVGYDILAPGGKLILVLAPAIDEKKRTADKELVSVYGNVHAASLRELGVGLYKNLTALLAAGDIKVRYLYRVVCPFTHFTSSRTSWRLYLMALPVSPLRWRS